MELSQTYVIELCASCRALTPPPSVGGSFCAAYSDASHLDGMARCAGWLVLRGLSPCMMLVGQVTLVKLLGWKTHRGIDRHGLRSVSVHRDRTVSWSAPLTA